MVNDRQEKVQEVLRTQALTGLMNTFRLLIRQSEPVIPSDRAFIRSYRYEAIKRLPIHLALEYILFLHYLLGNIDRSGLYEHLKKRIEQSPHFPAIQDAYLPADLLDFYKLPADESGISEKSLDLMAANVAIVAELIEEVKALRGAFPERLILRP